ncbi:PBP2_Bug_TTT domain containing protein [Rhabdaerophilaceae bacterium]
MMNGLNHTGMRPLHFAGLAAILVLGVLTSFPAMAQRSTTLLVGFAAGTAPDSLARILAEGIERTGGPGLIVENVAGAGGQIAAARLSKAPADGSVLMLGELGIAAIAPYAFTNLPYDSFKDFSFVSEAARTHFAFIAPRKDGFPSMQAFIDKAKTQPTTLLATFGVTSPGHIAAELLGQAYGFKIEPVHYRGVGDAISDLGNGRVAGAFVSVPLASAQAKGGQLAALVQTGETRSPLLADAPTSKEAGTPALSMSSWFVVMAPAGLKAETSEQLNKAVATALRDAGTRDRLINAGFEPVGTSVIETGQMVERERARWKSVIEKAGIKVGN